MDLIPNISYYCASFTPVIIPLKDLNGAQMCDFNISDLDPKVVLTESVSYPRFQIKVTF